MLSEWGKWVHRHRRNVLDLANVVGCGWGVKTTAGKKTDHNSMVVFVRRKTPLSELHPRDVVPLHVDNLPTDVVEVGNVRLLTDLDPVSPSTLYDDPHREQDPPAAEADRTARWRPVRPGVSFGHASITAGTLGMVVKDRVTGAPLLLSNNHVAANSTDGYDGRAKQGDPVLQPGAYDGGNTEYDVIGRLERFIPLHPLFKESPCRWARLAQRLLNIPLRLIARDYVLRLERRHSEDNFVDCAVVRPLHDTDVATNIVGLGRLRGMAEAEVGMAVKKSGRTSAVTVGEVIAVGATLHVGLGEHVVARFADQIVTTPMAQPGDSGALVLDARNRAVGLLFAGSEQATLCNRITAVCDALQIEM